VVNPENPVNGPVLKAMDGTAATLKLSLQQFMVHKANELDDAFAKIAAQHLDGVAVFEDAITVANARAIAQLAAKQRLPLTGFAELAKAGGLISYGVNIPALFRARRLFCRQDSPRRKTGRHPGRATDRIRDGRQSQDCEGA